MSETAMAEHEYDPADSYVQLYVDEDVNEDILEVLTASPENDETEAEPVPADRGVE